MGRRNRTRRHLQPHSPRLPSMGIYCQKSWHARHYPHRQTSRRLLPLAQPRQQPYRGSKCMAQRQRRRPTATLRCLPRARHQNGSIHIPVGPQRPHLRHPCLQRNLPPNPPACTQQLRRHLRTMVRRSQRRRSQRTQTAIRLAAFQRHRLPAPAAGFNLQRRGSRMPLDGQRTRPQW